MIILCRCATVVVAQRHLFATARPSSTEAERKRRNAWQGSPYFYKWFIRFLYIFKVTFEKVLNELKYLIVFL